MPIKIEIADHIPPEIEKKRHEDWAEYSKAHGFNFNYKRFSLMLNDNEGNVVGLLEAYTIFDEIYVEGLLIDSNHRRKGYGRRLIVELEQKFEGKGFWNINLWTSGFEAPEFYKKCGFELEFIRKNLHHPKLTKYYFVKYFKNEIQSQGIL